MSSDQFINEVDEELKRERQMALWQKYGRWVVAAALVVIIAVAAVIGWRHYRANERAEAAIAYAQAVDAANAGRNEDALKAFRELAADAPDGFAELARLRQAASLARQGNEPAAAEIYDAMSKDGAVAEPFRKVSTLLYVLATMDRADPAALEERLKPLTGAQDPWRYSALELTALLARKRGDSARAQEIFKRLADDATTPPGVRARAAEFLAVSGK